MQNIGFLQHKLIAEHVKRCSPPNSSIPTQLLSLKDQNSVEEDRIPIVCCIFPDVQRSYKLCFVPDPTHGRLNRNTLQLHHVSSLDANWGYLLKTIAEEHSDKTNFMTNVSAFHLLRVNFCLWYAPVTFQRILNLILSVVLFKTFMVCLEDVLFFSCSLAYHIKHVYTFLTELDSAFVSSNIPKWPFFRNLVKYFVHVLFTADIALEKNTTSVIEDKKFPETITWLRSFLNDCNFYRRFTISSIRPIS